MSLSLLIVHVLASPIAPIVNDDANNLFPRGHGFVDFYPCQPYNNGMDKNLMHPLPLPFLDSVNLGFTSLRILKRYLPALPKHKKIQQILNLPRKSEWYLHQKIGD